MRLRSRRATPNHEIATLTPTQASPWDAMLIVFGMLGLALGAFQWSVSPWFVSLKLASVDYVVEHGPAWLLRSDAPWWLLTNYPDAGEVFTWLDGALIVVYICATALVMGAFLLSTLVARRAARFQGRANPTCFDCPMH